MTVRVKTQEEIPQAIYQAKPGYSGLNIKRDSKGYAITFDYGDSND